jgi:hypothetical protein
VPRLRLDLRKAGERVILERFAVCDRTEERVLDLEAAGDAFQSWRDCVCR